jgi:hypothetical protein
MVAIEGRVAQEAEVLECRSAGGPCVFCLRKVGVENFSGYEYDISGWF